MPKIRRFMAAINRVPRARLSELFLRSKRPKTTSWSPASAVSIRAAISDAGFWPSSSIVTIHVPRVSAKPARLALCWP